MEELLVHPWMTKGEGAEVVPPRRDTLWLRLLTFKPSLATGLDADKKQIDPESKLPPVRRSRTPGWASTCFPCAVCLDVAWRLPFTTLPPRSAR